MGKKTRTGKWQKAQEWEKDWHDSCVNSFGEEEKQLVYAKKMGLSFFHNGKSPYNIDLQGKSVLDIGGGAYSLLLKCVNMGTCYVIDPLMDDYPEWVIGRYKSAEWIIPKKATGEDFNIKWRFDEVWIYNCLQHTKNPKKIIENARRAGELIRIFEWIDIPTNIGHPHSLSEKKLNEWLGGEGKIETINEKGCVGKCYYGIFPVRTKFRRHGKLL